MTDRVPLKRVASVRPSSVDKKSREGESTVRLCNYTDVYYHETIRPTMEFMPATATQGQLAHFSLCHGDVILTKDSETADDVGIPAFVDDPPVDLVCGYHLTLIRPNQGRLDGRYLFWQMSATHVRQTWEATAAGVTRVGLRAETVANLPIRVPALAEQRSVADFLDSETARIDAFIAKKQRLSELSGMRAAAQAEHLLGRFNDVPLQHLTDAKRPIVYGIVQAGPEDPEGVPYIKSGDIAGLESRELSRTAMSIHRQYARSHVRPGDIVVAMRASIGALTLVPPSLPEANLTQGTARVAAGPGVDGLWLYHVLRLRRIQEEMNVRAVGTTFRTLNIWDLRRIRIPTPPTDEQHRLAQQVESIRRRADTATRLLERQIQLLREHRQALITAAVSGELEVPGVAA